MIAPLAITEHAYDRAKKRLGLDRAATEREVEKVFATGLRHGETGGKLNRYLTRLYLEHGTADNLRIHSEHVFVFSGHVLITILHLPNEMKRAALDALSKRKIAS
ncbi:hypothetical protein [Verrucomicrobium sp. BvORR106]|uniref:hypothetical protein n=1 Tax=Verrucomicrobium sp. BvORR106 TaxID=1403819 RepID=UPI000570F23C|nr:hypothetical protein [Verrucomicrobium sp. BvORR106]